MHLIGVSLCSCVKVKQAVGGKEHIAWLTVPGRHRFKLGKTEKMHVCGLIAGSCPSVSEVNVNFCSPVVSLVE